MSSRVALPVISPAGRTLLMRAARAFSMHNRVTQAASESAELSAALSRLLSWGRSPRQSYRQVVEEGADTLLMLAQLGFVWPGFYRDLSRELARKMTKLEAAVEMKEREARTLAPDAPAEPPAQSPARPWWRFWRA